MEKEMQENIHKQNFRLLNMKIFGVLLIEEVIYFPDLSLFQIWSPQRRKYWNICSSSATGKRDNSVWIMSSIDFELLRLS